MSARRILLLDTGKEWGGGTNSMIELLKRIDRRRFEVTALFYRNYRKGGGSTLAEELAAIDIPLRLLPPDPPPRWEKPAKELARAFCFWSRQRRQQAIFALERRSRIEPVARRLAAELVAGGYQLLYMNNQPASNVEGYLAAAAAGIPVVQHCRIDPVMSESLAALVNAGATRVICVSDSVRATLLAAGVAAERCTTVYNGIDCGQSLPADCGIRDQWAVPAHAVVVGTVGRLAPIKRVADLIRAIALLAQRQPALELHLVVVGEGGEAPRLARLATELGVAGKIRFTGFEPAPLRLVAAMDIFALASDSEGLPRVILEAMLLAKPVVASDVAGSRDLVLAGQTGLLYPCGDVPALAGALARLAGDREMRQRLGRTGAARVRAEFSIERYVSGVEAVLDIATESPQQCSTFS